MLEQFTVRSTLQDRSPPPHPTHTLAGEAQSDRGEGASSSIESVSIPKVPPSTAFRCLFTAFHRLSPWFCCRRCRQTLRSLVPPTRTIRPTKRGSKQTLEGRVRSKALSPSFLHSCIPT